MKRIFSIALTTTIVCLSALVVMAQPRGSRYNGGSNGDGRGGGYPQRSFTPLPNSTPQLQRNFTPPSNYSSSRNFNQQRNLNQQRNDLSPDQRYYSPQRNYTPRSSYNVAPRNNYGYNRGYAPVRNYRFNSPPRIVVSIGGPYRRIPFGGITYNYYNGYWYRPNGASFQMILPPMGIRIGSLPLGYRPVPGPWGNLYYYNNVFYRQPENTDAYEVVDAPLGAQVPELPNGAEVRVIDGEKYYELDGTFYKESIMDRQVWYTVVGKNGIMSTSGALNESPADDVQPGTRVSVLPDGCKALVINGQKLYVSPNGNYYQEVIDGNTLWYEMVGK